MTQATKCTIACEGAVAISSVYVTQPDLYLREGQRKQPCNTVLDLWSTYSFMQTADFSSRYRTMHEDNSVTAPSIRLHIYIKAVSSRLCWSECYEALMSDITVTLSLFICKKETQQQQRKTKKDGLFHRDFV